MAGYGRVWQGWQGRNVMVEGRYSSRSIRHHHHVDERERGRGREREGDQDEYQQQPTIRA